MRRRLAIISTHPIQYQVPLWRALAQIPEMDVHVFYSSDFSVRGYRDSGFDVNVKWDVPLTEGYRHTFLSADTGKNGADSFLGLRATNLGRHLEEFEPDCALVNGYMLFFWWEACLTLRRMRIPIIFRAETTDFAASRSALKRVLRNTLLRFFYSRCSYCLAIGELSRLHYVSHGVSAERIGWSPYCIDTDFFEKQVIKYSSQRDDIRRQLGFDEADTVFIFSGKLIEVKDPITLVNAIKKMASGDLRNIRLIVVGDGKMRNRLAEECKAVLGDRVIFTGFVNQGELGEYYAASDCIVLPSLSETWGLVVNEALQFGLLAIVSDRVGCHPDLIVEGETGYVFRTGDPDELKECMLKVLRMPPDRRRELAALCRLRVSGYSVRQAADGIYRAVLKI